jgi:hypothetical protein
MRIRSGDLVRLSDKGPDFSVSMLSRLPSAEDRPAARSQSLGSELDDSKGAISAEKMQEGSANGAVKATNAPPTNRRIGVHWVAVAVAAAMTVIIVGYAVFGLRSSPSNIPTAETISKLPPESAANREAAVKVEEVSKTVENPKPNLPPTNDLPNDKTILEQEDPWVVAERKLQKAVYMIQLQQKGTKGDVSWPFATCSAIGDHTLLTTAREATVLAEKQRSGFRIQVVNLATGFKTAVRSLQVIKEFNDISDSTGEWIYTNLSVLETESAMPDCIPLASPEELRDLQEGMPVACIGYSHGGEKITSFDNYRPGFVRGKIYLIDLPPLPNESAGLLEFRGKIGENMYGSPLVNQRGALIAVYGEDVPAENVAVKDLHYMTTIDYSLVQSWLRDKDASRWIPPKSSLAKSPE